MEMFIENQIANLHSKAKNIMERITKRSGKTWYFKLVFYVPKPLHASQFITEEVHAAPVQTLHCNATFRFLLANSSGNKSPC